MFGPELFKWISFAVNVLRTLGKIFGTPEDKKAIEESEKRSCEDANCKVC